QQQQAAKHFVAARSEIIKVDRSYLARSWLTIAALIYEEIT
ncbi:MAG: hypothetical protein ACI843_001895, partial [Psychrobacter glaciei]